MTSAAIHDKPVSARDFGDVRAEFQALVSGCGVADLSSRAKIRLTGSDRVRWLNGMVTNNIRDLAAGHGAYAFLLNPQGKILGDLYAYHLGESILVDTDQYELAKVLEIFDRYIIMDDVVVEDISKELTAIRVAGPRALETLRAVGLSVPDLGPLEFREIEWRQIKVTLARGEVEQRDPYEIWLAPEHAGRLWEALTQAATAVGAHAMELHRIALGIPRYGQDIRERDLPQETEQARALHFAKGCYVGQEIVERIRSRGAVHRLFRGFTVEGTLPAVGSKILLAEKEVGEITSSAALPAQPGDVNVALGYIRREATLPGKQLVSGDTKLTVAELPFKTIFG